MNQPIRFAGIDGCAGGWVGAFSPGILEGPIEIIFKHRFEDLVAELWNGFNAKIIAVDMPIGLPDMAISGGRACDREARAMLPAGRKSSVFSPPCRGVLAAQDYAEALKINRESSQSGLGLSKQAWNIVPKIREVDVCITPVLQSALVRETFPELAFFLMNGSKPLGDGKKTLRGRKERRQLLVKQFGRLGPLPTWYYDLRPTEDDLYDAIACCWSARRIYNGEAIALGGTPPERDSRGLAMQIWL